MENLIAQKSNNDIEISLVEEPESYLLDLNTYIPKFLTYLWELPKVVSLLLLNSDINDVKKVLAPFFCNNFYQNILSPYTVEGNLLYIISFLLMDEIGKLDSVAQINNFLNNSPCGYLIYELKNKSDIQTFSKTIIQKIVEKIEVTSSGKNLNLNIESLINEIKNNEKELKKEYKSVEDCEEMIFLANTDNSMDGEDDKNNKKGNYFETYLNNNKKTSELFISKYMMDLDKKELEKIKDNYKEQDNMNEYITKFINDCNNDPDLFSNNKFIDKVYKQKYSKLLLTFYRIDFFKLIDLLDLLIESFLSSIQLLPYSIKCICKIVSLLVKNKFPDIKKIQENNFIAQILFVTLIIPLFINLNEIYINDLIISSHTSFNLKLLFEVFTQIIFGSLFTKKEGEYNYTPFNWYFLENMPKIFTLYEKIIKVDLPKSIKKLINNELEEDYEYDYFKENPDEIISHRSICYCLTDINCIVENMDRCKNILFPEMINNNNKINNINNDINNNPKNNIIDNNINNINNINNNNILNKNKNIIMKSQKLNRILTKLSSNYYKKLINDKINEGKKRKNKDKKVSHDLILMNNLLKNPKYDNLFNLEQNKGHFYIKELNKIENDEENIKNNIIRVKNYFCGLLYNCRKLNKYDFSSTKNTIEILKEIKTFLKTTEFVIDNSIPYEWYVNSLLECLKKIPKKLADNDYEKLYEELEEDLNKSIKIFDFYLMSDCFGKIKYTKKGIDFYNHIKNIIIDINLNEKVNDIIENKIFTVVMEFKLNEREKLFKLTEYDIIGNRLKELERSSSNSRRTCPNIKAFISNFPNFVKLQSMKGIDILQELEELRIPKKINDYLKFVFISLDKDTKNNKEEMEIVKEKIFDHILKKLYDKIYPKKQSQVDKLIYNNCLKLSWIEAKHLILKAKTNNYDIFMDNLKQSFTNLDLEKSPKKKYQVVIEIFQTILKLKKFNNENDISVDDNIEILAYIFAKIQPKQIHTNIEYMKLFLNIGGGEDVQLKHLSIACEILKDFRYSHLIGVNENEYQQKCQKALDEINNKNNNENNNIINII